MPTVLLRRVNDFFSPSCLWTLFGKLTHPLFGEYFSFKMLNVCVYHNFCVKLCIYRIADYIILFTLVAQFCDTTKI